MDVNFSTVKTSQGEFGKPYALQAFGNEEQDQQVTRKM